MMKLFIAGMLMTLSLSAADITGIWMGETAGKNGEKQDIAFQFKIIKGVVTGVQFGDDIDQPVQDLRIDGDNVTFSVGKTVYKGSLKEKVLELDRGQGPKLTLKKL